MHRRLARARVYIDNLVIISLLKFYSIMAIASEAVILSFNDVLVNQCLADLIG
jgi:hypothetical protein